MMKNLLLKSPVAALTLWALLAFTASPASAYSGTILFFGGEDTDFTITGSYQAQSTNGNIRNRSGGYGRGSVGPGSTGSTSDPPTNYLSVTAFAAQTTVWFHAYIGSENGYATTSASQFVRLLDAGTARIVLRGTGTSGQLKISKRSAAGTFTDLVTTAASAFQAGVTYPAVIDLGIVYGTSGSANLYINGVLAATYTGDVTTDGATTLNQAQLGSFNTNGTVTPFSEVIIGTADTRALSLWTLAPVASGTTQSWLPNTVGNINPVAINDVNLVATATNNALSGWTTPTTPPTGSFSLLAVGQSARLARGGAGPQTFAFYCRSGGTDNAGTDQTGISTSFTNYSFYLWPTNCTTAAAWAIGDITGGGLNLGIKARP